jgi:hypothetical protein
MESKKLIKTLVIVPIIILAILNLLTVFTPEIGFDALWYHLTLPKLWLFKHQWFFPGGLLYYSVMPRLTETISLPLIKLFGYVGPKLIQYLSALGTCYVIWKITSKLKLSVLMKILAISLFYCTWLVSWESGSAYIDLFRTFLEVCALFYLLFGSKLLGGVFLGLAIGTKWLSLGSLAIYGLVFGPSIIFPALLLASPWFCIAYHYTGNPLYPMFDPILHNSLAPIGQIVKNFILLPFIVTIPFDDFLSPMVFLIIILSALSLFSQNKQVRQISLVGLLGAFFGVALNPPSSRYLLPFFPALIISSVYLVNQLKPVFQKVFIILAIISSIMILGLRSFAFAKYFPYILGKENQNAFLTRLSDRLPDTFIDSDNFVQQNVSPQSKILIDKLHNLYYFPYNFDHTSWVATNSGYDYLITKDTQPNEVRGQLIHTNQIGIQVYKLKP